MPPEVSSSRQGQKGYREEVIFELIIALDKVIQSISNRKERRNKVAKTWT